MRDEAKQALMVFVVFAVLCAGVVLAGNYLGPTCDRGAERCDGNHLDVCEQREGRNPGRHWVTVETCEGACAAVGSEAYCVGPRSGSCTAPRVYCDGRELVTCTFVGRDLVEQRYACSEGACSAGECRSR